MAVVVTEGNVNGSTMFDTVLQAVRAPRLIVGRPRRRPETVVADQGYSSRAIRYALRRRAIRSAIPERAAHRPQLKQRARRGRHGMFYIRGDTGTSYVALGGFVWISGRARGRCPRCEVR
ncbi:transposase [Streptomyces sp. SID10815]|nr:transposase [Streptomyces sp. SID10815]